MNPLDTFSTVSLCCRQLEHWMEYKTKAAYILPFINNGNNELSGVQSGLKYS